MLNNIPAHNHTVPSMNKNQKLLWLQGERGEKTPIFEQ
jgi:hypothetical protein